MSDNDIFQGNQNPEDTMSLAILKPLVPQLITIATTSLILLSKRILLLTQKCK